MGDYSPWFVRTQSREDSSLWMFEKSVSVVMTDIFTITPQSRLSQARCLNLVRPLRGLCEIVSGPSAMVESFSSAKSILI